MKRIVYLVLLLVVSLSLIVACSPAINVEPQATEEYWDDNEVVVEKTVEVEAEKVLATPMSTAAASTNGGRALYASDPAPNRLIIKNAEMEIEVQDTDQAMDLVTQVVGDVGGYIVSSRIWYVAYQVESYKQASVTMGVPVDQFEVALRRLRAIAIRVVDESASGQDVTDEYVDLESRLRNLEATRDRIREFLDQAENVEEALEVNKQLSEVEGAIEQVQGRMNYLFDRASYSTITLLMGPDYAAIPTITPTPTNTPQPTATLEAYRPVAAVQEASYTLVQVLRGLFTFIIWLVILFGPFAVVIVAIWWLVSRVRKPGVATPPVEKQTPTEE